MMPHELDWIAKNITYKHRSLIEIKVRGDDVVEMRLQQSVPNVKQPNIDTTITTRWTIPMGDVMMLTAREFMVWVFKRIMAQERHEATEWLKVGEFFFEDPHPEENHSRVTF